tara:strand:- start:1116 stop:1589 length:474 start_codon:yes stop_codon:yes gene_type:complete
MSNIKNLFFSQGFDGSRATTVDNVFGSIRGFSDTLYSSNIISFDTSTKILSVDGKITATQIRNKSDICLKKDIQAIENALQTLCNMHGKQYKMKSTDETHFGFIAQEMQQALPTIVHEEDDVLNIAYLEIIPLIVEAIKQLNNKLDNIQEELTRKYE